MKEKFFLNLHHVYVKTHLKRSSNIEKKTRIIKKRNPEKMLKKLSTSNKWKGVSKFFLIIRDPHLCDKVHLILSKAVFKKYFL